MKLRRLACLLACSASVAAHAHTFCVSTAGDLTAALSAAQSTYKNEDNEVDITHGTYFGNWAYSINNTHGIVIRGGFFSFFGGCAADANPDASLTVLDAAESGTVLSILPAPGKATSGAVTISGLTFAHGRETVQTNGAGLFVGFIGLYTGNVLIERNIFRDNLNTTATGGGAGVVASIGGVLTVRNNVFFDNTAHSWSALSMFNSAGHANVTNNTIAYNFLNGSFASNAMVSYSGNGSAYAVFVNNIIVYPFGSGSAISLNSGMALFNNDISSAYGSPDPASNNTINVDPSFVDAVNGDLHLRADSPMIDLGTDTNNILFGGMSAYDLDGNDRVVGPAIDLGAYESDVLFRDGFDP